MHALGHGTAQNQISFLPQVDGAAGEALCAYLSLGICLDECLKRISIHLSASPNAGVGTVEESSVQSEEDRGSHTWGNTPQEEMERLASEGDMRRNAFTINNCTSTSLHRNPQNDTASPPISRTPHAHVRG
jgi:hypothetical protein